MLDLRFEPPQAVCLFDRLARVVRTVQPVAVTLVVFLAALVGHLSPELSEALQYDRTRLEAGQGWRAMTCHLVHWNGDHFFWDAVVFVMLGMACERHNRRQLVSCLIGAALAISFAIYFWMPELMTYRGLSGLDTGLFTLWLGTMMRYLWFSRAWSGVTLLALGVLGLLGKLGFELVTGQTLFVDSSAAGFTPIVLAHAIGALIGIVWAFRRDPIS